MNDPGHSPGSREAGAHPAHASHAARPADPGGGEATGIVLTHGAMSQGLVDAVLKITGVEDRALVAVSNDGKGPDALVAEVSAVADRVEGPVVIFTDMEAGSCALAARFVCRDPGNRTVLFGTNLPMLLDFVFHRALPLEELTPRLVERGKSGIRAMGEDR